MLSYLQWVLFVIVLAWAAPGHAWVEGDQEKCPARGRYVSSYGFSVTLPRGLKGCPNSPVGMSDHGVEIPLDSGRQRTIDAFAAYNVIPHETVADAVANTFESYRDDSGLESVRVVSRSSSRLGGLAAERLVLRYWVKADGAEMVFDSTQALRSVIKPLEYPSHAYSVSLTTPADRYEADRLVLERVLASWHRTATDDDVPARSVRRPKQKR